MIPRIKAAFEILKAPCFRTSVLTSRGYKHCLNLWQELHHEAKDAQRGNEKEQNKLYVFL